MIVTQLQTYKLKHSEECDDATIGRRVLHLYREGFTTVRIDSILDQAELHRGKCDCAVRDLQRVENAMRLARKGARFSKTLEARDRARQSFSQLCEERNAIKRYLA